jgi:hypothetical protein
MARAEESGAGKPASNAVESAIAPGSTLPESPSQHRFWDTKNQLLVAGVAGLNAADFTITRANLRDGGKELNPVTRIFAGSTAALAFNFAAETAATVGISYLFHRTGHHRLERATMAVAMSISAPAVIYSGIHQR